MGVKIVSDSTCDLSEGLLERYQISILPLHIVLGEQEFDDGKGITSDEIYRWSDENKTTPTTSAPAITDAMNMINECTSDGSEMVFFTVSEQMSTTANVMRMAADELEKEDRVFVIDSGNLSTGVGLLVIEAAIMAQNGKTAGEIVEEIEKIKPYVRASFVVDTLTYLYRGGRCSGLAALAGGALKLHPKIIVENGAMRPDKKYRGKISHVILKYANELEPQLKTAKHDRVFITHSGCEEEVVREVYDYLDGLKIFDEILVTRAGGVISSHCGPGTLGVLFIQNP
ncbi:MAG: DegV family protein [Schaedlerella sp.]|nr:DegV family protein [Lachnospiraceae bacterium]MDY4201670.1 DegV family protein [Schaedlerella sp.]